MRYVCRVACASFIALGFLSAGSLPAKAEFERTGAGSASPAGAMDAGVRPWDLTVRAFFGHDTNVGLAPDITGYNGEVKSEAFGAAVQGVYRFIQERDWQLGVTLYAGRVEYTRGHRGTETDAPDEYNTTVLNPGLYARRRIQLGDTEGSLGVSYNFRREWLPLDGGGLIGHSLSANASLSPTRNLTFGVFGEYADENFTVIFPDLALDSRDATRFAVGVSAQLKVNRGRTKISASYSYGENHAEGSNWDNTNNNLELRVQSKLYGPIFADLTVGRYHKDYDSFVSNFIPAPGRNHQEDNAIDAKLYWAITSHVIADVHFTSHWYLANTSYFEADRQSYGLGLSYKF